MFNVWLSSQRKHSADYTAERLLQCQGGGGGGGRCRKPEVIKGRRHEESDPLTPSLSSCVMETGATDILI